MDIKKSSVAITLAILGPTLLAGCGSSDDDDEDERSGSGSGYRGGSGYHGGGSGVRSSSPRGGFGGFGRFFSSGS